jgi:hypothetical protein
MASAGGRISSGGLICRSIVMVGLVAGTVARTLLFYLSRVRDNVTTIPQCQTPSAGTIFRWLDYH